MTPEQAVCYRRMLAVGMTDPYQRDLGFALEKEDPLSDLLLDLALCLSDTRQTVLILDDYIGICAVDEAKIHNMICAEMQKSYRNGSMDLLQIAETMFAILLRAGIWNEKAWQELRCLYYEYDEVKAGYWDMDHFLDSFSEYLFHKKERSACDDRDRRSI